MYIPKLRVSVMSFGGQYCCRSRICHQTCSGGGWKWRFAKRVS